MSDIFQILLIFVFCFFCHSLLHHFLRASRKRTFLLWLIYPLGFLGCLYFLSRNIYIFPGYGQFLPLVSLILFIELSLLMAVFYFSVITAGAQTPAEIIITSLQKKPRTEKELLSLFSDELLITKRIIQLKTYGLITSDSKGHLVVSTSGKYFVSLIQLASAVLGIPVGG